MNFHSQNARGYSGNGMGDLILREEKRATAINRLNQANANQHQIIVISDDEDDMEDVQVMGESSHKRAPSDAPISNDVHIPKRMKLENFEGGSEAYPGRQQPAYTKALVSFPNTSGDPGRARLTFSTAPTSPIDIDPVANPVNNAEAAHALPSRTKKRRKEAPYYDDILLGLRMYRGPGYEQFPIALGSNATHIDICEKWDMKNNARIERKQRSQTQYNDFGSYVDTDMHIDSNNESEDDDKDDSVLSALDQTLLTQILEVLPDAQPEFVQQRIRMKRESYNFGADEVNIEPDLETIVAEILDMESYPKRKLDVEEVDPLEPETGKKIKFVQVEHLNNRDYIKDAVIVLATQFTRVPTHYINKMLLEKKSIFDAYIAIEDADTNYFQRVTKPYARPRHPRVLLEKKYQRPNPMLRDAEAYCEVVNELQAAKQHVAREAIQLNKAKEKADFEAANLAQHKEDGKIIACQCCFDDEIPINRAVACENQEMHWFCFSCVKSLANSQVGAMKHEMLCMDGSGCKFKLLTSGVAQAVPIKVFDRLAFNQQQAEIAAAGLEGLEQCPWCDFKAICDPVEIDPAFRCQNPDCFRVTCRMCHERSHHPKSCDDFKNDRGLNARHTVEEARSEAMMRACPKCKTKIIKELGCNKMRCTCGGVMCYVCKADISSNTKEGGYEHFNRKGARCSLYDKANVDRHVQEANDAEKAAIAKAKELDEALDEKSLQIETGKNETKKPFSTSTKARPRAHPRIQALQNEFPAFPVNQFGLDQAQQNRQQHGLDGAQDRREIRRHRLEEEMNRFQDIVAAQRNHFDDQIRGLANHQDQLDQAQRIRNHLEEVARRRRNYQYEPAWLQPIPVQQPQIMNAPVLPQLPVLPPLDFMGAGFANNYGLENQANYFNYENNNNNHENNLGYNCNYFNDQAENNVEPLEAAPDAWLHPWNPKPNDGDLQLFPQLLPRPFN